MAGPRWIVAASALALPFSINAEKAVKAWDFKQRIAYYAVGMGNFEESLDHINQALEQRRLALGPLHPALIPLLHDRVSLLRLTGKFEQAEKDARWAKALADQDTEVETRAKAALALSAVLTDRGAFAESLRLLDWVEGEEPAALKRPVTLEKARLFYEKGDLQGHREHLEQALALTEKTDRQSVEDLQLELAHSKLKSGDVAGALQLFQEVLKSQSARLPNGHVAVAAPLEGLALCQKALGNPQGAQEYFVRAMSLRRATLGTVQWQSLPYLEPAASLFLHAGRWADAEAWWKKIAGLRARLQGPHHPAVAFARLKLALAYDGLGNKKAARREREAALLALSKSLGDAHPRTLAAKSLLP